MRARVFSSALLASCVLAYLAQAQTHTWDGGSATTNNWSDAANWDAAGAPAQPGTGVADDGTITHDDFVVWKSHYGESLAGGASLDNSPTVPEPAAVVIFLAGLACVAGRGRPR
jgi:hypothetical protein